MVRQNGPPPEPSWKTAAVITALIAAVGSVLVAVVTGVFGLIGDAPNTQGPSATIPSPSEQSTTSSAPELQCPDDVIACSDLAEVFTQGKSLLSAEVIRSSSLKVEFENTRTGTGVAFQFSQPIDIGSFRTIKIVGRATDAFSYEVQYKVKTSTGELEIADATSLRTFIGANTDDTVHISASYGGRADEIVLNFPEIGQSSTLSIDSMHLIR